MLRKKSLFIFFVANTQKEDILINDQENVYIKEEKKNEPNVEQKIIEEKKANQSKIKTLLTLLVVFIFVLVLIGIRKFKIKEKSQNILIDFLKSGPVFLQNLESNAMQEIPFSVVSGKIGKLKKKIKLADIFRELKCEVFFVIIKPQDQFFAYVFDLNTQKMTVIDHTSHSDQPKFEIKEIISWVFACNQTDQLNDFLGRSVSVENFLRQKAQVFFEHGSKSFSVTFPGIKAKIPKFPLQIPFYDFLKTFLENQVYGSDISHEKYFAFVEKKKLIFIKKDNSEEEIEYIEYDDFLDTTKNITGLLFYLETEEKQIGEQKIINIHFLYKGEYIVFNFVKKTFSSLSRIKDEIRTQFIPNIKKTEKLLIRSQNDHCQTLKKTILRYSFLQEDKKVETFMNGFEIFFSEQDLKVFSTLL